MDLFICIFRINFICTRIYLHAFLILISCAFIYMTFHVDYTEIFIWILSLYAYYVGSNFNPEFVWVFSFIFPFSYLSVPCKCSSFVRVLLSENKDTWIIHIKWHINKNQVLYRLHFFKLRYQTVWTWQINNSNI